MLTFSWASEAARPLEGDGASAGPREGLRAAMHQPARKNLQAFSPREYQALHCTSRARKGLPCTPCSYVQPRSDRSET